MIGIIVWTLLGSWHNVLFPFLQSLTLGIRLKAQDFLEVIIETSVGFGGVHGIIKYGLRLEHKSEMYSCSMYVYTFMNEAPEWQLGIIMAPKWQLVHNTEHSNCSNTFLSFFYNRSQWAIYSTVCLNSCIDCSLPLFTSNKSKK